MTVCVQPGALSNIHVSVTDFLNKISDVAVDNEHAKNLVFAYKN